MTDLEKLTDYVWGYYGPKSGGFEIKGLTYEITAEACRNYVALDPDWAACAGIDSDDRLGALNILLSTNPSLKDPYD